MSGKEWGEAMRRRRGGHAREAVLFVFAGGMTRPPVGGLLGMDPDTGKIHFRFPWRARNTFR